MLLGTMKGGNEDDKIMMPMFPRLHVNDTEKGGPRAPPRNKMSLYEQLSIPSQKFNSTTLPPHKSNTSASSACLSQGGSHRKTVHSQFYIHPAMPTPSIEKPDSHLLDVKKLETRNGELEGRVFRRMNNKSSHVVGSIIQASSLNEDEHLNINNSSKTKYDDGDDFRVPTFVQSKVVPCFKNALVDVSMQGPLGASNAQKSCSAIPDSLLHVPSSSITPVCAAIASDILSNANVRKCVEQVPAEAIVCKDHSKKFSTNQEAAGMLPDTSKFFFATSGLVTEANTTLLEEVGHQCTRINLETSQGRPLREFESLNNQVFLENRSSSKLRSNTCSGASLGNNHCSHDYKGSVSVEFRDAGRNDIVSEDSMVDSISVLEICPDDVVEVIGPKQFWKARRAIVNQQRVFAIQVFELHRLIKVQKLFAASPHLLLDDTRPANKIQQKIATKNSPVASTNLQPVQQILGFSQKPNPIEDRLVEKTTNPFPPLQAQERCPNHELSQFPASVPAAVDDRQNTLCFHPPPNQWLIPVMSQSEGLIYKPYSGPCPPATAFMAPLYGSCGQVALPTVAGDLLNANNGVPASNQQQNMGVLPASAMVPNYSSPYGMAVMNPVNSTSAVEQVAPLYIARPNGGNTLHSRGSHNMSITRSDAFSGCPPKHDAPKESELQGSTASSPCDRPQLEGKDVLPLFPVAPAAAAVGSCHPSLSSGREQQTHVIKVVPHNARSATESAARIFRSIQEERQQLDM